MCHSEKRAVVAGIETFATERAAKDVLNMQGASLRGCAEWPPLLKGWAMRPSKNAGM